MLVTSGEILVSPEGRFFGQWDISGVNGFSFVGHTESGNTAALCQPCAAGEAISLATSLSPTLEGSATFRGEGFQFTSENGGGGFDIAAPSAQPVIAGSTATIETPFDLLPETVLTLQRGEIVQQIMLSGTGRARGTFNVFTAPDSGAQLLTLQSIRFDFLAPGAPPVPEPGSLLLLTGGLATAWVRARSCGRARA